MKDTITSTPRSLPCWSRWSSAPPVAAQVKDPARTSSTRSCRRSRSPQADRVRAEERHDRISRPEDRSCRSSTSPRGSGRRSNWEPADKIGLASVFRPGCNALEGRCPRSTATAMDDFLAKRAATISKPASATTRDSRPHELPDSGFFDDVFISVRRRAPRSRVPRRTRSTWPKSRSAPTSPAATTTSTAWRAARSASSPTGPTRRCARTAEYATVTAIPAGTTCWRGTRSSTIRTISILGALAGDFDAAAMRKKIAVGARRLATGIRVRGGSRGVPSRSPGPGIWFIENHRTSPRRPSGWLTSGIETKNPDYFAARGDERNPRWRVLRANVQQHPLQEGPRLQRRRRARLSGYTSPGLFNAHHADEVGKRLRQRSPRCGRRFAVIIDNSPPARRPRAGAREGVDSELFRLQLRFEGEDPRPADDVRVLRLAGQLPRHLSYEHREGHEGRRPTRVARKYVFSHPMRCRSSSPARRPISANPLRRPRVGDEARRHDSAVSGADEPGQRTTETSQRTFGLNDRGAERPPHPR